MPSHEVAIQLVLEALRDDGIGVIKSMDEIGAVGHRVVASGEYFKKTTLVTPEVLKTLEEKTFDIFRLNTFYFWRCFIKLNEFLFLFCDRATVLFHPKALICFSLFGHCDLIWFPCTLIKR